MVAYLDMMSFYLSTGYGCIGADEYDNEPYGFFARNFPVIESKRNASTNFFALTLAECGGTIAAS
ncbi:hypothetical protein DENSPDRAFT_887462 [Dentipellis sp. KUC8613]|nr:hypothetical protein DENSPDRAFT_887462 [Dentipellis sp. KUC8613]